MPTRPEVDVKPYVEHHPIIGYAYRPSAELTLPTPAGDTYTIRTNRQGIRSDREFSREVPAGRYRIIVLGDSVAAGQYCANHERFSELLEIKCDGVEVINFALEGTGTDQQLLIFTHQARSFDFDMLLLCPYIENIRRNLMDARVANEVRTGRKVLTPKPRFDLRRGRLVLRNVPVSTERPEVDEVDAGKRHRSNALTPALRVKALANRSLERLGLKRWLYRVKRHEPFPEYRDPGSHPWRLMTAIIESFVVELGGRPLVIAPQVYRAYLEHDMADNYLTRFRSLERLGNVHTIDILPYFRRLEPAARRACYWPDDCHFTPFGHRVAADALYTELGRTGLLPRRTHVIDGEETTRAREEAFAT